jgi:hypothetical protein
MPRLLRSLRCEGRRPGPADRATVIVLARRAYGGRRPLGHADDATFADASLDELVSLLVSVHGLPPKLLEADSD